VVIYPEGIWYRCSSVADVDAIIEEHLMKGRVVERLRI
jgi:(2Fe-2S) ferredoxin